MRAHGMKSLAERIRPCSLFFLKTRQGWHHKRQLALSTRSHCFSKPDRSLRNLFLWNIGPIAVILEWVLKDRPTAAGAIAAQGAQGGDDSMNA